MDYIVLDMEWNQAWPGSYAARKVLETPINGEIIQIGAVRLSEDRRVLDEFQLLIRPKYYKKLNRKISSLTGIREEALRESGVDFPSAIQSFRRWCGKDFAFLIWGYDDIRILKQNLMLFHLDTKWVERWYNAQLIFSVQMEGAPSQKALKTAMEIMEIPATRPAHDALGDAYHTALICAKLDLAKGIAEYSKIKKPEKKHPKAPTVPQKALANKIFSGYADRQEVLIAMSGKENLCPDCSGKMSVQRWLGQPDGQYVTRAVCPDCGKFLVWIRLQREQDNTFLVSRTVYANDAASAAAYDRQLAAPAEGEARHRRRRRHHG